MGTTCHNKSSTLAVPFPAGQDKIRTKYRHPPMAVLRALFQRLPIVLLVAFHTVTTAGATPAKRSYSTHDYYVLQLDRSAPASIHDCAGALGVEVVEQVGHLRDHWLVRVPSSSLYDESERRSDLDSSSSVDIILERFQEIRSVASSYLSSPSLVSRSLRDGQRISRSIRSLERQVPRQRIKKRVPIPELPSSPSSPPEYPRAPVPPGGKSQRIAQALGIIDPIFNDQWHLANNPRPNFDLNVSGVWESGIRGKGVCVAVVDDGLDLNSDDLHANFVRLLFVCLDVLNSLVLSGLPPARLLHSMRKDHGTITTTQLFLYPVFRMTSTARGVQAKLRPLRTTFAE